MRSHRRILRCCLLILSAGFTAPAISQSTTIAKPTSVTPVSAEIAIAHAKLLLDHGKADQAWRDLNQWSSSFAGNPNFDYLLGIAALDSGRFAPAVLAFERVLAQQPDNLQARAE